MPAGQTRENHLVLGKIMLGSSRRPSTHGPYASLQYPLHWAVSLYAGHVSVSKPIHKILHDNLCKHPHQLLCWNKTWMTCVTGRHPALGSLDHDSPYSSVLVYRSAIGTLRTDILTHDTIGYTHRLVCTAHIDSLLDRYIPPILGCMSWYGEPCS